MNSDGAVRSRGKATAGGLIRNHDGTWLGGFMVNIGKTTVVQAELVGVKEGLKLAKALGCQR